LQLSQVTKIALAQAKIAFDKNEVPVGAVVFNKDKIITKAYNMIICKNDPLGHAEIIALKKATKKLKTTNLRDCSLYVTLEPCPICSYIISKYKVGSVYFGAYETREETFLNSNNFFLKNEKKFTPKIYGGIGEKESKDLLIAFFKMLRKKL
jgi:tRNA(adenine34) deaminase